MSNCWKCGRDLPEGQVECEYGCGDGDIDHVGRISAQALADIKRNSVQLDWTKVKTLEDVITILGEVESNMWMPRTSPMAQRLKRFTKDAS